MEPNILIGVVALAFAVASGGALGFYLLMPRRSALMQGLSGRTQTVGSSEETRARMADDETGAEFDKIKQATKGGSGRAGGKSAPTLDEQFFRAGMFSPKEKQDFFRMRAILPFLVAPIAAYIASDQGTLFLVGATVLGAAGGARIPTFLLDYRISKRSEDILFYLPLVIEQIVIGVSSSLDIGPCISRVVSMSDERDSHNCVTEMLALVEHYSRTGISLEEALTRVGRQSGHTELKHTFMSLAQVTRHGGEVTKQLQELADAVGGQREAKVDEKIKKLELKATGPVAIVFMGFMIILLIGFGIQIQHALQ